MLFFLNYLECCVSVSFGSIHFTEVLYSVPFVHLPITANILQPEIFSSVEADRSLNSLIPTTLHTTYGCIFLPGENLLGVCFSHAIYLHLWLVFLPWLTFSVSPLCYSDIILMCTRQMEIRTYSEPNDLRKESELEDLKISFLCQDKADKFHGAFRSGLVCCS